MKEKTLVLIKPEAVQRHLIGKIISRFEDAGLKIVGMKMVWIDEEFAKKHYTEDISKRRGEFVRNKLLKYLVEGPVVAIVLEGVDAIENVRRITGSTEPKTAQPGTIRGDFAHVSYKYADDNNMAVKNIIHSSSNEEDAKNEIALWFKKNELHDYKTIQDYFF
ncbi:MAG: nucleoside-diphosphate kinase [Nanoarchaeota archaeon]|nr:nucleoside-diphosphate kinase [Nanoarchaeota archaeon]